MGTKQAVYTKNTGELIIATLNVRSPAIQEKELGLQNALTHMKLDIIGLSEVRKHGEAIIEKTGW
jgi:hypothetical protein